MSFRDKKIGLLLPQWEDGMAGKTASGPEILELAKLSEDIGVDSVWLVDHFLFEPYVDEAEYGVEYPDEMKGKKVGFWECWTLASALAAITDRVEIGTLVANTGYRNPALHARMADTVDELSGGRLIFGIGAGDYRTEHDAFGYPWERRVGRFEEALQIICPLLKGESVTFGGEFYSTEEARLAPKGPRPDGPPILIGLLKGGPRMKRLVTQYADHWNCWLVEDSRPEAYRESYQSILEACEKHGRDPATLVKNAAVGVCFPGNALPVDDAVPFSGSNAEIAEQLSRFLDEDVDHLVIWLEPCTRDGIEQLSKVLEQLD